METEVIDNQVVITEHTPAHVEVDPETQESTIVADEQTTVEEAPTEEVVLPTQDEVTTDEVVQ